MMLRETLAVACIFIIASLLCYPLFALGTLDGHDAWHHLLWAHQWLASFKLGVLYPQWVPDAFLGCGDASFIFYPPFLFFTYILAGFFTSDVVTVISLSAWIGLWASGIAMYAFSRMHMARIPAFLAAVLYTTFSYHLIDLYVRGTLAEFWAFVWLPLIALCILKTREGKTCGFICLAACIAGLILTHLPVALLALLFFEVFVSYLLYIEKSSKSFCLRQAAFIFGIGISAIYLIPALSEQQYVNIRQLSEFRIEDNFLFNAGGGFTAALNQAAVEIVLVAALGLLATLALRSRKFPDRSHVAFFAISGLVCFIALFHWTAPLWLAAPLLQRIQFPWRLLSIASFCASICSGFIASLLFRSDGYGRKLKVLFSLLFFGLLAAVFHNAYGTLPTLSGALYEKGQALKRNGWIIKMDQLRQDSAKGYDLYLRNLSKDSARYVPSNPWLIDSLEYKPIWSIPKSLPEKSTCIRGAIFDTCGSYIIYPTYDWLETRNYPEAIVKIPTALQNNRISIPADIGRYEIILWEPERRRIKIEARESAGVLVRTFYYIRWKAYENGRTIALKPDAETGLIRIDVPKGSHIIDLVFEPSGYRIAGKVLTVASLLGLLLFALYPSLPIRRR